jgi:hypothetical protein
MSQGAEEIMNPMDQSRRSRFRPIGGRGCLLLSSVVLTALAGCEGVGSRQQRDPMLGPQVPAQPAAAPGSQGNTPAQAAAEQAPPSLPSTYAATSPAALASGETATPEQGRDLRITGDTSSTTALPSNGAARGVAPGVSVGNPEPAASDSTSRLAPVAASTAPLQQLGAPTAASPPLGSAAAKVRTFEDAQQFLKQHNVKWQRLDEVDVGWWKFECSVPNPSVPQANRHYYTSNPFPDPLSAIRAVITEMEQKPQ